MSKFLFLFLFSTPFLWAQGLVDVDGWELKPVPAHSSDAERNSSVDDPEQFREFILISRFQELQQLYEVVGLQCTPLSENSTISEELRALWHDVARLYAVLGTEELSQEYGLSDFPLPSLKGDHFDLLARKAEAAGAQIKQKTQELRRVIGSR